MDADSPADVRLTDTQLGILATLCRPISAGNHFATPATNQEIADEVFLSVDAVKGHLRTLYRKFAIEDLPHNQKRARLVELAIEGGYIEMAAPEFVPGAEPAASGADRRGGDERPASSVDAGHAPETPPADRPTSSSVPSPSPPPSPPASPPPERIRGYRQLSWMAANAPRRWALRIGGLVVLLAIVAAVLALAGVFSSGSSETGTPTPAAFRAKVAGYCKLALEGAPPSASGNRVELAQSYLEVIETMRGRFESLTPPAGENQALERFGAGLTGAAEYTSDVAESPAPAGSAAEAKDVAELTFAAGQVQAGAVGYGLGQECLSIGDLVARSAENAAAP